MSPVEHSALISRINVVLLKLVGLRTLMVSGGRGYRPTAEEISNHAPTLKELYIDSPASVGAYNNEWYRDICSSCSMLEQVALPIPACRSKLEREGGPIDKAEAAVSACVVEFRLWLNQLLHLSKLRTLRILEWSDVADTEDAAVIARQADPFAAFLTRTFKAWQQHTLSAIAPGRESGKLQADRDRMLCYLVKNSESSWRTDDESGVRRVSKEEAMAEELCSEILDVQYDKPGFLRFPR